VREQVPHLILTKVPEPCREEDLGFHFPERAVGDREVLGERPVRSSPLALCDV
jgi:hypothetical protein